MKKLLNGGWEFALGTPEHFSAVRLPHDWLIASEANSTRMCEALRRGVEAQAETLMISNPSNLYAPGIGWYRRTLDSSMFLHGQRVFLRFDGVMGESTLFVNGKEIGCWKYGYTAFEFDITDSLNFSGNTILLKVEYNSPCSRWYTGAGIYRDVCLIVKNPCHFVSDGIYVTTFLTEGQWTFDVTADVVTDSRPYEITHDLLDGGNRIEEWDIDHPRLYTLRSTLRVAGEIMDSVDTRIGFRTIECTPDRGFFLNGRHLKLRGVCLHHDLGLLGAAVHTDAIRRQLAIFKAMGANAIRTAHNPPASIFMSIADEMGFLVLSEISDVWHHAKTPYDYARHFDEWIEKDVASWIRRDRNHPSVIMWSLGNEIPDTHKDPENATQTLRRLMSLVEQHDPRRHARVTLCSNYMPWANTQECADIIKLIGYNYAEYLYAAHHALHPDWIIYGSETCSTVQSRGIYHFPLEASVMADDDLQCSALGNSRTSWGAENVESCIKADDEALFSLGQFVWAGQDYLGEPTPYHTKNSYLGHVDTAGFPKDSYFIFQAAWTDWREAPMIHLWPYWDFSPGQMVDVRVCSNAPTVELFLDGTSLGKRNLSPDMTVTDITTTWKISYRPGTLKAVAYGSSGEIIAEKTRSSFEDAHIIKLNSLQITELSFITITALDSRGNLVENANRRINVLVKDGELLGLDNGDSTDYEPYGSTSRRMFNGKLLAIVRGSNPRIEASFDDKDIPVRKIELVQDGWHVEAQTYPPDATHTDLHWRVTDEKGIDTPLVQFHVANDQRSVEVVPKGDGTVYIRCGTKNGKGHLDLYAQREMTITGKGKPFLDPYSYVSGGLYSTCNRTLTNGNERGIATARDGESHVVFADLDFGSYGSNEISLDLFPLDAEPFTFSLWDDMPGNGGMKICDLTYDKGSIWNTYQRTTYQLPRRLSGIVSFCLVFRQKVHIKGFVFTRLEKAFQRLNAGECDSISGDTYVVRNGCVQEIGNNVSLVFKDMDFGVDGAMQLELCWKSRIPHNSVRVTWEGKSRHATMVELSGSESYIQEIFPLGETIRGRKTIILEFLPGCIIDVAWLRFLP